MHSHALLQTTVGMEVWFILIISMRSAGPWEISAIKQGSGWAFLIQPPYKMAEGQQQCGSIREELFLQLQQLLLHLLQVGQRQQVSLLWMKDVSFSWKNGDWRILQHGRKDVSFMRTPFLCNRENRDGLIGHSHGRWENKNYIFPDWTPELIIHIPSSPNDEVLFLPCVISFG